MTTKTVVGICLAFAVAGCGGDDGGGGSSPGAGATIWTTSSDLNRVRRIDTGSGDYQNIDVGEPAELIALGAGAVWVTTGESKVVRIDPSTNEVVATIPVGAGLRGIAATDDAVWVTDDGDASAPASVHRIDPATNTVAASIELAPNHEPVDIAAGPEGVYVVMWNVFSIGKIDPATNTLATDVELGQQGGYGYGELTLSGGSVWVLDTYSNILIELDQDLAKLNEHSLDQLGYSDMVVADGRLFVSDTDADKLLELDPASGSVVSEIAPDGDVRSIASKGSTIAIGLSDGSGGDLLLYSASGQKTGEVVAVYADALAIE